jgi:hypothetical protein
MNTQGFCQFLQSRRLSDKQVEEHIAIVSRFEEYLCHLTPPLSLEDAGAEATQAFVDQLTKEGSNSYSNLLALARYGLYSRNDDVYRIPLELLDGAEVFEKLYRKVGEVAGEAHQSEIFHDIQMPPLGTPNKQKTHLTRIVMERINQSLDLETHARLFADCFRDLPDAYFEQDRLKYLEIGDFDQFLEYKRAEFIAQLEQLKDEGRLFFNQEVTQEVVDFVRADPEISQGVRVGNILYVTKIPYQAKQYLAETDPFQKRYYACHCPWARESLQEGETPVSSKFCACSAGYHKKPWEVVFGQPLQADVLESALQGDLRCRFAIHLPGTDKGDGGKASQ